MQKSICLFTYYSHEAAIFESSKSDMNVNWNTSFLHIYFEQWEITSEETWNQMFQYFKNVSLQL